ncbi:MAG: succinate dehydrogenase flavoprotein subunit [Geobacteraceae bacterium]|nr:succinate dehydrogenase flavoprotein subunit [Geobacteraceae bacterium]
MTNRIIIVGGGLSGLMSAIKVAEAGCHVDLFSLVPVRRSHSVCAQGGINGCVQPTREGDSPDEHFDDTIYGGDFLANQTPVRNMCHTAPSIIKLMDRMGVMFNRTPEGNLDFRAFGGAKYRRTAFAGATTGQQLLYALDEQVRRFEVEGKIRKFEFWEFLGAVIGDDGICRGISALDMRTMEVHVFAGDAVIMATGGPGVIFGKSTNSAINTGTAAATLYTQGVKYANGEFIQVHPTALQGIDKLRLMSESARGEGGRVWTYKDGKPWYFLEEKYPAYGNLVPRDIATREIFHVCVDMKLGIDGKNQVYLDLTHLPAEFLDRKLGGILEIYEKFMGEDPRKVPMRVFPGVHYSMGGMWVDYDQMTNIPGLFAVGECDYQYHGANRLGANALLSCIYSGMVAGPAAVRFGKGLEKSALDIDISFFDSEKRRHEEEFADIFRMDGPENPYCLARELGELMTENVTVVRYNDRLRRTDEHLRELQERWKFIGVPDTSRGTANQAAQFTRQLGHMLDLARVITVGALLRDESRGAHYKPDFPERNDEKFLKTTIAEYCASGPKITYEEVDLKHIPPRPRVYNVEKKSGKTGGGN